MNSKEKILQQAKLLFSEKGYAGVSMRKLATNVKMSVAAIYHHFPDKQTLYLETMLYAFESKSKSLNVVWNANHTALDRLQQFVELLINMIIDDPVFNRLIQREILEADNERMQLLAAEVFQEQFNYLLKLISEIAPEKDAHLTAISILSLIQYHIETQPLRCFLPFWKLEHEQPQVLATHVMSILRNGILKDET